MQITAVRRVERVGRIFSAEVLVGTAFVALALVLFAAAMTANLDYDEEQYVAGAYFARSLSLYRDFISFQPPTYTWITAAVFQVIDGWYLLTARVLTWVLDMRLLCLALFAAALDRDRTVRRVRAPSGLHCVAIHARTTDAKSQ